MTLSNLLVCFQVELLCFRITWGECAHIYFWQKDQRSFSNTWFTLKAIVAFPKNPSKSWFLIWCFFHLTFENFWQKKKTAEPNISHTASQRILWIAHSGLWNVVGSLGKHSHGLVGSIKLLCHKWPFTIQIKCFDSWNEDKTTLGI